MRYKKGDRVYIREDLKTGERCKKTSYVAQYFYRWFKPGEFVTIEEIIIDDEYYRANGNGLLVDSFIDHIRTEQGEETPIPKDKFHKGDYIVPLHEKSVNHSQIKHHYVYKQRLSEYYIVPEFDSLGSNTNSWILIDFNDKSSWRYATPEEIALYDKLGKPCSIEKSNKETTLKKPTVKWADITIEPNEKVKVKVTPETSKLVQQWCFDRGIYWFGGTKRIVLEEEPYIFIDFNDKDITCSSNGQTFKNKKSKEVTLAYFGIDTSESKSWREEQETKTDNPQLFKIKKRGKVFKF